MITPVKATTSKGTDIHTPATLCQFQYRARRAPGKRGTRAGFICSHVNNIYAIQLHLENANGLLEPVINFVPKFS